MNVTRLPIRAGALITGLALLATMVLASAFSHWECQDPLRFAVYACLAAASGTLKIRLPGSTSTFSLSFVFVLLGVADLSLGETLAMLAGSMVVQTIWRSSHPARVAQSIFNLSSVTLCTALAFSSARAFRGPTMVELAIAAAVYFTSNTLAVSVIQFLALSRPLLAIWRSWFEWPLAYYAVGVSTVTLNIAASRQVGWGYALLVFPLLYLEYTLMRFDLRSRAREAR